MKRFDEALDQIENLLTNLSNRVKLIRRLKAEGRMEACYVQLLRLEDVSERLTLLTRSLPIVSGSRSAPEDVEHLIQDAVSVEIGYTEEGWFCVRFPLLLPKKESGSNNYVRGFLYPAMRSFFTRRVPVVHPQNVLIYRHVYDRSRPKRRMRDHDNIEINMVSDIVAMYVMPDDAPRYCSHYYCSAAGSRERTEVYVVPKADFPIWFAQENYFPEEGVFLYENRPGSTENHM